jgi:hypothetical protein
MNTIVITDYLATTYIGFFIIGKPIPIVGL